MKLAPDYVQKPLVKLRKQLDTLPADPRPEDVHSLRTQTRRLEATVAALIMDRDKRSRRLIKIIAPMRKAAGKVRDMDVLIGHVLTLQHHDAGEGLVRLVEHLAKMRLKSARKLHGVVSKRRQEARRRLKQTTKLLRKRLKNDSSAENGQAAPQILLTELRNWPDLDSENLHPFRIRIKELRYMLQLTSPARSTLFARLGAVKDIIGEWHDWVELLRIARKVLDVDDASLKRIDRTGKEKLQLALVAANQLRARYLDAPAHARGSQ